MQTNEWKRNNRIIKSSLDNNYSNNSPKKHQWILTGWKFFKKHSLKLMPNLWIKKSNLIVKKPQPTPAFQSSHESSQDLMGCNDDTQRHHLCDIPTKNVKPDLIMRKYQINPKWGTIYERLVTFQSIRILNTKEKTEQLFQIKGDKSDNSN